MKTIEANFDGLVGPTHNYGGLSFGNLASAKHANQTSNPKAAAKEGLRKMKLMMELGMVQGILPPHDRPHIPTLKSLGYGGSDAEIIEKVAKTAPGLLNNVSAAAAMWTANAATVSPSADSADGRVHFTPANLATMFHRAIEPPVTGRILKSVFADEKFFSHHNWLQGGLHAGDEGAANHNRFCTSYGARGVELFVYGKATFEGSAGPEDFPARQRLEASRAVAEHHGLKPDRVLFVQQNPLAINAGAFHNDVVAVANKHVFFYHELAFEDPEMLEENLRKCASDISFEFIKVAAADVSLKDAISSYLFNSQLISPAGEDKMTLIMPENSRDISSTKHYLEELIAGDNAIDTVKYIDVRQSMQNGGGPACLRLRVVLSEEELAAVNPRSILTEDLHDQLNKWVDRHYRDRLIPADLADPKLLEEGRTALDELSGLLGLGSIYDFQRDVD